jgi:release factor glutamine methyltransferase
LKTFLEILNEGCHILSSYSDTPYLDSKLLIQKIFGLDNKAFILALKRTVYCEKKVVLYFKHIEKRKNGMPLAYILNTVGFQKNLYVINKGVFIPRPETEEMITTFDEIISKYGLASSLVRTIELGFGAGIISLEIAKRYPNYELYAWDISKKAYKNACRNQKRFKLANVTLFNQDFFADKPVWSNLFQQKAISFFLSNPPYIAQNEMASLPRSVKEFEPKQALNGGAKGLKYYKKIFQTLTSFPVFMILEIGTNQFPEIKLLLAKSKIQLVAAKEDIQGIPRIVLAHTSSFKTHF